ncbi:23S rRNA (uracil(1939)-C(5))-methyltransferase RlmD [Candidatus Peregrinibacteria bacterium]|nr:23S rRNA (uracil(1939)-C(5))-methyltransferase RlmD [Candidatus Peregrinibacteria bacterium]
MPEFSVGKLSEGTIEKLAYGGKGVLHLENFVVFVQNALPGQLVRFQITHKKKNYAEAKVIEVLKRSPIEIEPEFEKMPGCPFQTVKYEDQLKIKESQVFETLQHLGGIAPEEYEQLKILPSPEIIRYRNKVEFSFGYEVMRVEVNEYGERVYFDENPTLGFHPEGKWALVKSMNDCFLVSENVNSVRKLAEEIMQTSGLPIWNPKISRGFWRSLILRESKATGNILMNFIVSEKKSNSFWKEIAEVCIKKMPKISGVLVTQNGEKGDALRGNPEYEIIWGTDILFEKLEQTEFMISPFAFFQTNTRGAEKLFGKARDFACLSGKETILDLFCGTGAIGLFLAKNVKKIVGIEFDQNAISDAEKNAKKNGLKSAEYFCGKAEQILPDVLEKYPKFDVVFVDPPRAGMHPKAMEILKKIPSKKMIFISCNPATLARDLRELRTAGWKLKKVQPVDMFPHTPHIETVALLDAPKSF